MSQTELQVKLPKPHGKQKQFEQSPAKRRVVVAGRRGGKTTEAARVAVKAMLRGRRVLEAAPVSDQTNTFWARCKRALSEPIAAGIIYKNETDRLLQMPNEGGRIRCKTAHNADTLRGDYADLLILDEYSIMDPTAWTEVGAPMLLDNDGDAIFIFTPKRKNHAYALYAHALGDDSGRWAAFHFTSYDNPYLSREALADITFDMPEESDAYRQEILAQFLDNEGAVFRNILACTKAPLAMPEEHARHTLIAGLDWGKQQDYTATSIGCLTCHAEVARDRYNQIDYTVQRDRLKALYGAWGVSVILAESNSIGIPNIEMLQQDGLPVLPFETTGQSKPPLIENLALTLELAEWQFQPDPIWTAELEAYERTVSKLTGRSQYSAPAGVHDDTVMARALMVWQAEHMPQANMQMIAVQQPPSSRTQANELSGRERGRRFSGSRK